MASVIEPAARAQAQRTIETARLAAIRKHGELQGGMKRWVHHLQEECQEAIDEMLALDHLHSPSTYHTHKVRLITELAQVAQLAQSMIVLAYLDREKEERIPWQPEDHNLPTGPATPSLSSLSKEVTGVQRPRD